MTVFRGKVIGFTPSLPPRLLVKRNKYALKHIFDGICVFAIPPPPNKDPGYGHS